jgi:hypothetical protein
VAEPVETAVAPSSSTPVLTAPFPEPLPEPISESSSESVLEQPPISQPLEQPLEQPVSAPIDPVPDPISQPIPEPVQPTVTAGTTSVVPPVTTSFNPLNDPYLNPNIRDVDMPEQVTSPGPTVQMLDSGVGVVNPNITPPTVPPPVHSC